MKVFISYHRKDSYYRHKVENILSSKNIDYYAVPEDADFNGKKAQTISDFINSKVRQCDVILCLIGDETYSRPHVDREIHCALKGEPGERLGIVAVFLPTRGDGANGFDKNTVSPKLTMNKDYVVWCNYIDLNKYIVRYLQKAFDNSRNGKMQTNHSHPCMQLRTKLYYDN